jgi:alpha-glucosidase
VAAQAQDPGSTLAFYKAALAARREHAAGQTEDVELLDAGSDVLALTRGSLTVVLNAGAEAVELPAGEVLVASGDLDERLLPPDTAVWLLG